MKTALAKLGRKVAPLEFVSLRKIRVGLMPSTQLQQDQPPAHGFGVFWRTLNEIQQQEALQGQFRALIRLSRLGSGCCLRRFPWVR